MKLETALQQLAVGRKAKRLRGLWPTIEKKLAEGVNTQRHTIAQALASSDYTLMEKQRIRTFSRDVFEQLRALKWQ